MRIAVLGAGSIGSVYGGLLTAAGHDVWLLHRRREHVDQLNRGGLRVDGLGGGRIIPVKATTDPAEVGQVELAFVLVKSTDTATAIASAKSLVGANTTVLTLQNGLGNADIIAAAVGPEKVLSGTAGVGGELLGPGHVVHTKLLVGYVGEVDGTVSARVERVVALMNEAGLPARASANIMVQIWDKLLRNSTANAACALTGYPTEFLFAYASSRELIQLVARETASVARAAGVVLPYDDPVEMLRQVWPVQVPAGPAPSKPSMLQDFEKGRPSEIDFINGAVVREGERLGVPTPYNRALTLLVKMVEAKRDKPGGEPEHV